MAAKGRRSSGGKKAQDPKDPQAYDHKKGEEKLLLRPDVGLQAQFKQKRPPKSYRYDPSLDPALSWDVSADRERAEALIARIEHTEDLAEAKAAATELRQMSRPFLNWAGKAERGEFTVPTLPLFVHERLSTQAILQSVTSHKRDRQQTLALFADEELDVADRLLKAYTYQTDWVNRLILGDSLVVMNSLLQYEGLGGQVQMIFMDPPYGVKFGSNFQPFIRRRDVKHGDDGDLTREPEMVQAYRDTWELGLHSYLTYLRDRLLLARELLNEKDSIFVQISDENLHHVRELMDEVFGAENCIAVIAFKKTGFASDETLSTTHDFLLWYAKCSERMKLRSVFGERELTPDELFFYDQIELPDGTRRPLASDEKSLGPRIREIGRPYARNPMVSPGWQDSLGFSVQLEGRTFRPPPNRHWATTQEGIERLRTARRLAIKGNTLRFIRYFDDFPLQPLGTVWNDTGVGGFVGDERLYVVQTDVRVVQRCLLMTTDPSDLVLDPTCGSGTTAYVAEQWGRRWITIDTSRVPLALARQRLLTATFPYYELRDPSRGPGGGFIYKRKQNQKGEEVGGIVPHVTLKSIAQNEPPQEEVLVDRPEVESVSSASPAPSPSRPRSPQPSMLRRQGPRMTTRRVMRSIRSAG